MSPHSTTHQFSRRLSRDTGFPESFDGVSNTTLPHPDADLSPNAVLTHDDLCGDHALKRKRLTFLHRKHKHNISHGVITPQTDTLASPWSLSLANMTDGLSTKESARQKLVSPSASSFQLRTSKDETESLSSKKDEDTPPTSPDGSEHRSRGRLSKWRRG